MTDYLARTAGRVVLAIYGVGFISACVVMIVKLVTWVKCKWREVTGW